MLKLKGDNVDIFKLNNNVEIPAVGFGTYMMAPAITEENVTLALQSGYRLIDTAQNYGNEREVGAAVNKSGISRDKIFVTSKTQTTGYNSTKRGIDQSLSEASLDYFDLMIIHWPNSASLDTYRALEDAYKEGKLRAIGLSNFNHLEVNEILKHATVKPVLDQIETHLYNQQKKMHKYLTDHNILHESWSPLGEGSSDMLINPVVKEISQAHNVSTAQVLLRFLNQENILVIPKSTNLQHIKSNIDIFDFELTNTEIKQLQNLDQGRSMSGWPASMAIENR